MSKPVVLMLAPMNRVVMHGCVERFELVRLWEAEDPDAVLAARGSEVRAIAFSGPDPLNAALMDKLPHLEIVANFGVGYDMVDAQEAARRGVMVTNGAGSLDDEVADTAMGLLIMTVRELSQAERHLRNGRWPQGAYPLTPMTLSGRRMGILGMGRIGEAIARRASTFGLTVGYHNRRRKDSPYRYYPTLLEMARDVDTLILITPGGPSTRHLVNAEVLDALGPRGIVINMSRGTVVDDAALIKALKERKIHAAGLDVFVNEPEVPKEYLELDNVVLFPYLGSSTVYTRQKMEQLVVDNLLAWAAGNPPITPVPETPWPPKKKA